MPRPWRDSRRHNPVPGQDRYVASWHRINPLTIKTVGEILGNGALSSQPAWQKMLQHAHDGAHAEVGYAPIMARLLPPFFARADGDTK